MILKVKMFLLLLAVLSLASSSSGARENADSDYILISRMEKSNNIEGIENIIRGNSSKWLSISKREYGRLMAHGLESWKSICYQTGEADSKPRLLLYAEKVLLLYGENQEDTISIENKLFIYDIS